MNKILNFFKESYSELKKVVWPGRGEVGSSTRVVIVSTLLFALILGVVDFLLVVGIDIIFFPMLSLISKSLRKRW